MKKLGKWETKVGHREHNTYSNLVCDDHYLMCIGGRWYQFAFWFKHN